MFKVLNLRQAAGLIAPAALTAIASAAQGQTLPATASYVIEQKPHANCETVVFTTIKWVPATVYHIKQLPFTRPTWEKHSLYKNCK